MTLIHRYIAKTVILASLLVIVAVLGLCFFIGLLGELRDVGTGDYGFQQAVVHVVLKLPHDLYQFFPMLMLLGGVLGLGILASHHELIVIRTAGTSLFKVMQAVVTAALVLIAASVLIGEGIAPHAIFLADKHKQSAENGGQAVATTEGVWIHESNNFLHIDHVVGHRHLEGIRRYQFDAGHRLLAAYYVKSADFENHVWMLKGISKTTFEKGRAYSQQLAAGTWDLVLNPNLLNVGIIEPQELSLPKLLNYSHQLSNNPVQTSRFQFQFWKRVFQPFTTLVMILLAIPFVFAGPRSGMMGWRILFGVTLGFVFYILNALLGQICVVYQITPWIAALFPTVLFAGGGAFLMWKVQ